MNARFAIFLKCKFGTGIDNQISADLRKDLKENTKVSHQSPPQDNQKGLHPQRIKDNGTSQKFRCKMVNQLNIKTRPKKRYCSAKNSDSLIVLRASGLKVTRAEAQGRASRTATT